MRVMKKKTNSVYIETTVISYLISRASTSLKLASEQLITQEWWQEVLPKMKPYISTFVVDEISLGDKSQALKRIEAVSRFEVLQETPEVKTLANLYLKELAIPAKSKVDAFHLAMASIFEIDFMVSWNCKHIANPFFQKKIESINNSFNLITPVICTPREMSGEYNEE